MAEGGKRGNKSRKRERSRGRGAPESSIVERGGARLANEDAWFGWMGGDGGDGSGPALRQKRIYSERERCTRTFGRGCTHTLGSG